MCGQWSVGSGVWAVVCVGSGVWAIVCGQWCVGSVVVWSNM